MGAGEAFPVPRIVPVGHSSLGDHLKYIPVEQITENKLRMLSLFYFSTLAEHKATIISILVHSIPTMEQTFYGIGYLGHSGQLLTLLHLMHFVANFSS